MHPKFNVLILAAGFGTRLGKLGIETPKGLIKVGDSTILDFIIDKIKASHPNSITLLTNQRHYPSYQTWLKQSQAKISLFHNGIFSPEKRLGALKDASMALKSQKLANDDLLILPSDTLFDFSLTQFIAFALNHPQGLSTIFREFQDKTLIANRMGCGVVIGERLIDFYEKPAHPPTALGAIPLYYYPKTTLPHLIAYVAGHPKLSDLDAPGTIIPWLLNESQSVFAHTIDSLTLDVGTPADLPKAAKFKVK